MNPFEGVWVARCGGCAWRRCTIAEVKHLETLRLLGLQHMTESDGHLVYLDPGAPLDGSA